MPKAARPRTPGDARPLAGICPAMPAPDPLVVQGPRGGLYCPAGDFWIDPLRSVETALITHAHADHARSGSATYWCAAPGAALLRRRVDPRGRAHLNPVDFGAVHLINGVRCSWHPAGHILGSAQIRLEAEGQVWVVTGDYKRAPDPSCRPFEPVPCDVLVTEATFGLPVYRWPPADAVMDALVAWWRDAAAAGDRAALWAYSLGKTQRILACLAARTDRPGPLWVHRAAAGLCADYAAQGVTLAPFEVFDPATSQPPPGALILTPPAAEDAAWRQALRPQTASASGWMRVRRQRHQRPVDRGFVLSDHADWPALLDTVRASQARTVYVMHSPTDTLARYLREVCGLNAGPVPRLAQA